jgi:cbb3-type cytochrome oxidase subunit 3
MTQLDWFFTAVAILATPAFIAFVVWHYRHKRKHKHL